MASLIIFVIPSSAFAASGKETSNEQKIESMMADGLSNTDATYYASLDSMMRDMEKNNQKFDYGSNTASLSDKDVLQNQADFRKRVLDKDPAAMKKALSMSTSITGAGDIDDLRAKYQNMQKYEIIYSDGSKISVDCKVEPKENTNVLNSSGLQSENFASGMMDQGYTTYTGYAEYTMTSLANYSKNRIDVNFNYAFTGTTMTYAVGNQSSYGVVLIANSNNGVISRASGTGSTPAEANNAVIFQVSGSVGGSYNFASGFGLSASVNAGKCWTQTTFFRAYPSSIWRADSTVYT